MKQLKKVMKVNEDNKDKLIDEFFNARDNHYPFIVLEIEAEGTREFIVIPRESFADKLSFYQRSYTDDLVHVMNKNVSIKRFKALRTLSNIVFV